jgi:hypothetical protein
MSTVLDGVPLSQRKSDEILNIHKGKRPSPDVYLPIAYVDTHLAQFYDRKSRFTIHDSRFTKASDYHEYGLGKPGTMKSECVGTKGDIDNVISQSDGNMNEIARQLGIPPE